MTKYAGVHSVASGLLFKIRKAPKERQAAPHRQDPSVGHDAWEGHCAMSARAGLTRQAAINNCNLHTEKEAGSSCVRALGVPSALANVMQADQHSKGQTNTGEP